jgi:cytochrome d ubiquinol oxidase subunit I
LRRRDYPQSKWFLWACAASGVASVVALECGWIVTEVGRQPWVVYDVMLTKDAITHANGIWIEFTIVLVLYVLLGAALVVTLIAMARRWRSTADPDEELEVPYGPDDVAPQPAGGAS